MLFARNDELKMYDQSICIDMHTILALYFAVIIIQF